MSLTAPDVCLFFIYNRHSPHLIPQPQIYPPRQAVCLRVSQLTTLTPEALHLTPIFPFRGKGAYIETYNQII